MPILTFERVLKIISTILNILVAALAAFTDSSKEDFEKDDEKE